MSGFPTLKTYLTYWRNSNGQHLRPCVFWVPRVGWISGIRTWSANGTYYSEGVRGGPFMSHEDAARHALSACRTEAR